MAEVGDQWHLATSSADWGPRARFPVLAYNGKMWVLGGGYTGAGNNDVYSSVDGVNWTTVTTSAPWSDREWNPALVHGGKMWVIGGRTPSGDLNDVWYSSDGANWTAATLSAPWSPRCCHSLVSFGNKMWILGGTNQNNDYFNDVWSSIDGVNWTQETASAEWGPRHAHTSVVFDDKIWILGGSAGSFYNDIWSSSNGINWNQVTASASWSPRYAHSSTAYGGKMWVLGGYAGSTFENDAWASSDGASWTQVTASAEWNSRSAHASVAFNNKLWIFGGFLPGGTPTSDVWYSEGDKWYDTYDFNSKGAVAYFPLDGNANDVTGNGNDGTISGAIQTVGRFGQSFHFDGNSYIQYTEQYAGLTAITYAMWFQADALFTYPENAQYTGRMPFKRRGGYADHWVSFWTNRLAVTLYDMNGGDLTNSSISTGEWHHLAFGSDGVEVFAYLDGIKVFEKTGSGAVDWSDYIGTFIGHSYDSGSVSNWIGKVDEVVVFNRALNDFEAERLASDANSNGIADFWDTDPPVTIDLPALPEGARPIQLVRIPAGSFEMGSPVTERGRESWEETPHTVNFSQEFWMTDVEITQAQWVSVSGVLPTGLSGSGFGEGNDHPVYFVSWEDCQKWINGLNKLGLGTFRLPTEAEWEYACRANTQTRYFFGDNLVCDDACTPCATSEQYMWWCNNSAGGSHSVGLKSPNGFGLFDMAGNLYEWCQDFDGVFPGRIHKGGSWRTNASRCRSGFRVGGPEDIGYDHVGFRLIGEIPPPVAPGQVSIPRGLSATGGPISVLVTWDANPEHNITGYHIYRDTNPNGSFSEQLNDLLVTQPRFEDTTALSGTIYYYKVSAESSTGIESQKSGAVQASRGTVEVWMPDVRGPADSEVVLPINVTFATGITGNGMDVKVTYDPNLLTPIEVQKTVLTQSFTFLDNISIANGQINISGISSSGATIVGEGHILDIVFHVSPTAVTADTGTFTFVDVTMFDATPSALSVDFSGTSVFTVALNYILGDVDGSGAVNSGDALIAQQIVTGERTATALELQAADISGDGIIDSADVTLILRIAVGLPVNPVDGTKGKWNKDRTNQYYHVSVGSENGQSGEFVSVPVEINTLNGVAGVDLVVNFDPTVLQFQSVSEAPLIQSDFLLEYRWDGSSLRITLSSSQASTVTGGILLNLVFGVVGNLSQGSNLPLAYLKLSGQYGENLAWSNNVVGTSGYLEINNTSGFDNDAWLLYE